jgi:hypothetical protein
VYALNQVVTSVHKNETRPGAGTDAQQRAELYGKCRPSDDGTSIPNHNCELSLFQISPLFALVRYLLGLVLATSDATGAAGGDETDLGTRRLVAANRGRRTNVLVVTTTVWMLDRLWWRSERQA